MKLSSLLLLLPLSLAACGGNVDEERPAPTGIPTTTSQRFIGCWVVTEEQLHATSNSTFYLLTADGRIEDGGSAFRQPFGVVTSPNGSLTCRFGERWGAADDSHLVIEGVCSDGVRRPVAIDFVSNAASNGAGAKIALAAVGGEKGWRLPPFGMIFMLQDPKVTKQCKTGP
jgi:hypothetical protein